jgi:hypothetical protein
MSLLKHHSLNAEFVTASLIQQFNSIQANAEETEDGSSSDSISSQLMDDLKHFYLRF